MYLPSFLPVRPFSFAFTRSLASAICSEMLFAAEGAKSPEPRPLQKIHPRVSFVPSRVGHVQPASTAILYILVPKSFYILQHVHLLKL